MPALNHVRQPARAGFTLAEIVVAVALMVPVVVAATTLAVSAARQARAAAAIVAAELAQEVAAAVIEAELAPLVPGDGLLSVSPTAVRYRSRRAAGRWCLVDTSGVVLPLAPRWAASRQPVAGRDSAVIYIQDISSPSGVRVLRLGLVAPPVATVCPGGPAAIRLAVPGIPVSSLLHDLLQMEEVVELAVYSSAGQLWLGLLSLGVAAAIEPVAGPFAAGSVLFEGLDAAGSATAVAAQVRTLRVRLGSAVPAVGTRTILIGLRG